MTTPQVLRYANTEFLKQGPDEFIVVIDSLGRRWNPLKHPRDENGRFIRTFSFVTFDLPGGASTPGGAGGSVSGRVSGIDKDGNLLVKVQGVGPGAPPGVKEGDYVKVPHDQVEVRTVKAQLGGRGAAGVLNKQENASVNTGVQNLQRLGLDAQAEKLAEAQALANERPNPRDPASVERKQRAIDLMREVAEELGEERGKGFAEGADYEEVKAELTSEEKARLQTIDQVMGTTFTARHSLGDKTIDAENDEGPVKAKAGEVRIQTAEQELRKDFEEDAKVWDATSGTLTEGHLEQPVKAEVRDRVREQQGQKVLPELQRSTYQKLKTGLSRLSGYKQAQQVAPGDRFHTDKNGDEVVVGSIVHTDPTKSRAGFTGMVTRIYTDKDGKKHVYVRDFDPGGEKSYPKGYKDHSVQGSSIELAGDDEQAQVFSQLALMGASDSAKSLVNSFTADYMDKMSRRYASPDAKRISPTGGFFDVAPVQDRIRQDINGEAIRIGDSVMGPNGEVGVVTYIDPNENTTKVQYPNGQKAARVSSRRLTRLHGPSSDVYPGESGYGDNNYVPTREEAAADAEAMGADSVAQVIRDGGDSHAIQAAMVTDTKFQQGLDDVDALYDRRDRALSAGQELPGEDRDALARWDRIAAASAGQFREEPERPPEVPRTPEPEAADEDPTNPANPEEKVTEGGVTVREEDGNVIVDDNVEDPIPSDDQQAIDQAVEDAEAEQEPGEQEPPPAPALAQKLVSDVGRLVEEAKNAPNVDRNQRSQLDQMMSRLAEAVKEQDGDAVVRALRGMTTTVNRQVNANLRQTRLAAVMNGRATDGVPMADFVQQKLDAGEDIFDAPKPVTRADRPTERPDETPEGVDTKVDKVDNAVSEALLMDDGSTMVMQGDQQVDEGFYVVDPATVTEYDNEPTTQDITEFLNETQGSDFDGVSIWFDEDDGRYRMARVGVFDNEQDASDAAANSDANQYVNIADGAVMNVALGGDANAPTEAVEDPRSEERAVRVAGTGRAKARSTSKQKKMLDHVAGVEGADPEISRITEAVKNGEEITGADASRLADYVDGLGADQFEKPSDKGVASQMAHRLARAAGEEGARGYSSQNTALRRTSDVGISLSAQSRDDNIRSLVDDARTAVKNGDNAAAAQKFRDAADAFDALNLGNDVASRRAREHADRLDAMGGVTAPPPAPEQQGPATAREALDAAGMPEVEPLTQSQFSNPDTPRTRQVSPQEYAALALKGRDRLDALLDDSSAPDALQGETWDEIKSQAWDSVQEEWGGVTIDAHTGQAVTGDEDAYAVTFRPPGVETVSVPIGSSQADFDAAMERALQQFGGEQDSPLWASQAHLGVFRNDDTGNYEIDPVLVFDNLDDVEAVGAYSGSEGGAYNFKDGLGYWPPYVAEEEAGGAGAEEGVPGARRLEGTSPEGGEAEPGVPAEEQAPEEPAGGREQAEEVAQVNDALSDVESAIEEEVQSEGDNGPIGWTPTTEEANDMLGLIRGRVTSEGPYTELSNDLRELAIYIENNWQFSDPSSVVDDLRAAADALDGEAAPEGGSPGGEGGGAAPFRHDDPAGVHRALVDSQQRHDLEQREDQHYADALKGYKALLSQVEEGSLANREVNDAKFEMIRRVNAAETIRANLNYKIKQGELTPEHVESELARYGDDAQAILDIWNGESDATLSAGNLADFLKQRVDARVGATREEASGASREDAPLDLRFIRSQMETGSIEAANRRENSRVGNLAEYQQLVTETAAILNTVQALRDPNNRAGLRRDQVAQAGLLARLLEDDMAQARTFLAELNEQGVDTAALDGVLREQLEKFGAADLLDASPDWSPETMTLTNRAGKAYRDKRDAGESGQAEGRDFIDGVRKLANETPSPYLHRTLSPVVSKVVSDQIAANDGTIPDSYRAILSDPAFERFGAFTDVLARLDVEEMIRSGDVDLNAATGGRYTSVEWQDAPTVNPGLVTDDRPEGSGSVEADMAWEEGLAEVTPNVASALNSMFTSMGGGIHRVQSDITQASAPEAERWKSDAWARAGSDMRTPEQVEGVYAKGSNIVVIADSRAVADTGSGSHVIVHELGHALDSMLGETLGEGTWFTDHDPEFQKFHASLKDAAAYGRSPEQSLLHWYFRDQAEGAAQHNGISGKKEVFAEGYAAYAAGLRRFNEMPEGSGPISRDTVYALVARQLTQDRGKLVEWAGELSFEQIREREIAMGQSIMNFFDDLEKNRLPKIMAEPKPMPVRSALRNTVIGMELGAAPGTPVQRQATPSQKRKADTHLSKQHGLIQMQPVERGTPEWQQMEAAVKQASPGATLPSPTALYTTWNPDFANQGTSVIWKAVMPSAPDKPTTEYTDQHKATQLAAKFQREQRNNAALDQAHAKAEAEAMFDETAALVLAMIETGMRVGSSGRAGSIDKKTGKKVPTFGGATMQAKHVFFPSQTLMRFKFPGKAGKENVYESRNPVLRAAVEQLLEGKKPSDQVFANTNSDRSINYLREATGIEDIINHDVRTRFATNMARDLVAKWPKSRMPKNEAALKKAKTEIAKKVGVAINDTWTVARDSYISDAVWAPMEDTAGVPHSFDDSPPYGLVEGETVTTLVPGAPGGPPAPEGDAGPPAQVAAAEAEPEPVEPEVGDEAPEDAEIGYTLDHSPAGKAERRAWYDSFLWPDPPIVAGPETTFSAEDGDDDEESQEDTGTAEEE